jgi:acylphosphatase
MQVVRILVTGRVQGVGFRAFVTRRAAELGLAGWVRNRPDGAVEAEAAGPEAALRAFVAALETGPRLAHVQDATTQWFERSEAPAGFHITG